MIIWNTCFCCVAISLTYVSQHSTQYYFTNCNWWFTSCYIHVCLLEVFFVLLSFLPHHCHKLLISRTPQHNCSPWAKRPGSAALAGSSWYSGPECYKQMGHKGSWTGPWNAQKLSINLSFHQRWTALLIDFLSSITRGLALVLSLLHPRNLAALWLACRPQTSHGYRRLNTRWTVAAHSRNTKWEKPVTQG